MQRRGLVASAFRKLLIVLAGTLALEGADFPQQLRTNREILCPEVRSALPLDGDTEQKAWKSLPWSEGFIVLDSLWVSSPVKTAVALARDADYLYVGMRMAEPEMKNLKERSRFSIWQNDVAEILLWKKDNQKEWLHLAVDCAGNIYFAKEIDVPEMPGTFRSENLSRKEVKAGVKQGKEYWSVTAAIPMSVAGKYFGEGSRINFGRQRRVPYSFSSWCKGSGLRDYARNGVVRLTAAEQVEKNEKEYLAALRNFQSDRLSLVANLKARIHTHAYAFSAGAAPSYRPLLQTYSPENGAGWLSVEGIRRESLQDLMKAKPQYAKRLEKWVLSPLANTYLCGEGTGEHTFRLDLPNGKYKVHLLSGIIAPELYPHRRRFTIHAQGREVKLFDVGHMLYLKYDFLATVEDGRLLLTFRGCPDVLQDNPGTLPFSRGDAKKFYVPGWLLNSLVVTPMKDRKAASRQIALDELEITHCPPEKLANYEEVRFADPGMREYPEAWKKRGYVLYTRPFGTQLYRESRPVPDEITEKFHVKAVPGEPVFLNFGLLPLRDLDQVKIEVRGLDLDVEESRFISTLLGGGKYCMAPVFNDRYENCDRDCNQGENRWIWLTGRVPESAGKGMLRGEVRIEAEGKVSGYPVEIEVLPFRVKEADFAFGGFNPLGYNRPGKIYEDRLAQLCRKYEMHMHLFYVDPFAGEPSWTLLKERIRLYQKNGIRGPFLVYVYLPITKVDQPLRNKKISRIPDDVMKVMLDAAGRLLDMHRKEGYPELIFAAMDEAHCKGDPYWSEQVRLNQLIKAKYPELKTAASESDRSMYRIKAYLDAPIVFEVDDFNVYRDCKRVYTYTNQYLLKVNDMNSGRMQCGWIPATVKLNGLIPWMLYEGTGESRLLRDDWTMIQQRGVGGYHYMPKLAVLMGTVGLWDLRYVETLKSMIAEAEKSSDPKRKNAAAEAKELLNTIRESTKPSIKYYYHNGYWAPEVFCRLRELVTEQILALQKREEKQ